MLTSILIDAGFFIIVFLTTFFGAMSGGAGLVVRPILIFLGVPPHFAIGTTRTANVLTRLVGLSQFHKHGKIDWKLAFMLMIPGTIGSIISVEIVVAFDPALLTRFIGLLILLSGVLLLIRKDIGTVDLDYIPSKRRHLIGLIAYGITTFIATLTGGGGVINNFILLNIYKKSYIAAAAVRKVAGFGGSIIGSLLFIYYGLIDWHYAIIVLVAGSLGGYFGIRHGIHKGETWVRYVVLIVIFIFGAKMLFF